MNYHKFMDQDPFEYGQMTNSKGQTIHFYEHPFYGDEHEIIVVCHSMQMVSDSGFFDIEDMTAEHGEYEPWFDMSGEYHVGNLN